MGFRPPAPPPPRPLLTPSPQSPPPLPLRAPQCFRTMGVLDRLAALTPMQVNLMAAGVLGVPLGAYAKYLYDDAKVPPPPPPLHSSDH